MPSSQHAANLQPVHIKYVPLPAPLPALDDKSILVTASAELGLPCRRCLADSKPGEQLNLMSYDPFPVDAVSPYRGSGPIFVHAHECSVFNGDVLPQTQLNRLMSLRAYNDKHMMINADVADGHTIEKVAQEMLADEKTKYINVHNAKHGCYAVTIGRD